MSSEDAGKEVRSVEYRIQSVDYGGRVVIRDLRFTARTGSPVLIRGSTGSGKSTLCHLIAGLLDHRAELRADYEVQPELSDRRLAYVTQDPDSNILTNDAVSELLIRGATPDALSATFSALPRLEALLGKKTSHLSGGERQLLSIGAALARESDWYILDEPTAMLDQTNREAVVEAIAELRQRRVFSFVSTHEPWGKDLSREMPILLDVEERRSEDPADEGILLRLASLAGVRPPVGLDFRDLSAGYRSVPQLLKGVSAALEGGDTLRLVGPNGSGKTTLCLILAGQVRSKSGTVAFRASGETRGRSPVPPHDVGVILQNPNWHLLFDLVQKELEGPAQTDGCVERPAEWIQELLELGDRMGLRLGADPRALSFGQRKLVTLLSSLYSPPVQIFDEPEVGLDERFRLFFARIVDVRRTLGLITIIVSHNPGFFQDCITQTLELE